MLHAPWVLCKKTSPAQYRQAHSTCTIIPAVLPSHCIFAGLCLLKRCLRARMVHKWITSNYRPSSVPSLFLRHIVSKFKNRGHSFVLFICALSCPLSRINAHCALHRPFRYPRPCDSGCCSFRNRSDHQHHLMHRHSPHS